jgi:hypothetical protein
MIGFIAPGKWNGPSIYTEPDYAPLQTGDMLEKGYMIMSEPIDFQSQADRDARIAPPIYVAIKLAGAIHTVMVEDTSSHDLASDGSVMTSKVEAPNGSVAIAIQQTSAGHAWFTRLFNYLRTAPAREWAQISLMATASDMRVTHTGQNLSIQKRPDKPYQAQGQQVTWTFLAGKLDER